MHNDRKLSSTEKVMLILKTLSEEPCNFTAKELSEKLNINRSTIHRIINDLIKDKFVIKDKYTKRYKLGPTIFRIGSAYMKVKNINDEIISIVNEIAENTKESVGFYIKDEDVIISLYETESFQVKRMGYRPGATYPINAGSVGKCITAFLDEKEIVRLLECENLEKYTQNTTTDPEKLIEEYNKIREQGFAVSDEDKMLGTFGVAAPVFNSRNQVMACIAIACFKTGLTDTRVETIKKHVVEGANKVSELIP